MEEFKSVLIDKMLYCVSPMGRKFLAAREELVKRLHILAKNKNTTLYGLTNQILEQALLAEDLGEDLPEIIRNYRVIKMAKENRSVLIPQRLWHLVLEKASKNASDSLKEVFYDSGQWYGKYFTTVLAKANSLQEIKNFLEAMFWNVSNLDLTEESDKTILKLIEPNFDLSHTQLLSIMLEGIMHSIGYATQERNITKGLALLTFTKK